MLGTVLRHIFVLSTFIVKALLWGRLTLLLLPFYR